jgi:hypothetical protein
VALYSEIPSWNMLAFVFLFAMLGTFQRVVLVPLTNIVFPLGAPMLPAWRLMTSTYLQFEPFLSIIFPKLLIIFVHSPNVVLRSLVITVFVYFASSLFLFVHFSVLSCFLSPVFACNWLSAVVKDFSGWT